MLDHPDMGLDCLPPGHLREQFTRLIRQLKPDVLVAGDPFAPGETHPDHRATAWAASDAVSYAFLPLWHPEHLSAGLQPHFVQEKYFYSDINPNANNFVDISDFFEKKLAALAEHRSQMEFLVEDVARQAALLDLDLGARLEHLSQVPMEAVSHVLRSQAAECGKIAGCQYAEAFRYTRFHPYIESFLDQR
jgi:LmbE family N-acetylglucosaminyl deacetylase